MNPMLKFLNLAVAKKYVGKTALVRVDLNIDPDGAADNLRIDAVIPTIQLLLKHKVRVVLLSHRGRPKGIDAKFSLQPFADILFKKLGAPVIFIQNPDFRIIKRQLQWSSRKIFLLENLRFSAGEEENDETFARALAELGDCYVNDAFAVSHRAHASVAAITKFLPSYGGLCLEKELSSLDYVMKKPPRPFTLILGGAKVGDKLPVLDHFVKRVDYILLGSGPACTFFAAQGLPVGHSIVDRDSIPVVKKLLKSKKIMIPDDVSMVEHKILDIGPRAVEAYAALIKKSRTILWNGPMGMFEKEEFAFGTREVWKAVLAFAKAHPRSRVVVGGGETIASAKLISNFEFLISNLRNVLISTGGGAMLEYLSGKELPGIKALK
ncbi:MAG: phosphoglycerate kinase [Candidatus Liptonbacteria bacterium]